MPSQIIALTPVKPPIGGCSDLRNLLADLLRLTKGPRGSEAAARVRDGFWWRKLSDSTRRAYVVGYLDARHVGRAAGAAIGGVDMPPVGPELDAMAITSALDEFFADSDNWAMALPSAMYYVIRWHEDPKADHSELLRRLRGAGK